MREYSPTGSQGEYFPKITGREANNCFSIFTQVNIHNNWLFTKFNFCWRLAAFLLLCSPVGEYKACHVKFCQSQRRIFYIYLCKSIKSYYNLCDKKMKLF